MRRFVGEINVPDCQLAMDIIQALENNKLTKYDIDLYERNGARYDSITDTRSPGDCRILMLKVFVNEEVPDEQLEMGFK